MKAVTPVITDKPCFNLIRARHPLIDKDKVVPISLKLGNDYSSLIVTGPNTGGKTVSTQNRRPACAYGNVRYDDTCKRKQRYRYV